MDYHGFLLVDKPCGITSAEVIRSVKRQLSTPGKKFTTKLGHAGTLDPMATGLLILLFGNATRVQDEVMHGEKEYEGIIRLGVRTDTDDITGTVIEERVGEIPESQFAELEVQIEKVFSGVIQQTPPSYSAIKVDGVRSYALARNDEAVELNARPVVIHSSTFRFVSPNQIRYRVHCGKGTYIRSIARDVGPLCNTVATLESIRRTMSGGFRVAEGISGKELTSARIVENIRPLDELLREWPRLQLSEDEIRALRAGDQRVFSRYPETTGKVALCGDTGVVALAEAPAGGTLRLRCVF